MVYSQRKDRNSGFDNVVNIAFLQGRTSGSGQRGSLRTAASQTRPKAATGRTATVGNRAARGPKRWQVQLLLDSRTADETCAMAGSAFASLPISGQELRASGREQPPAARTRRRGPESDARSWA